MTNEQTGLLIGFLAIFLGLLASSTVVSAGIVCMTLGATIVVVSLVLGFEKGKR